MTKEQINDLKVKVLVEAPLLHPQWREGQAYFNYLYELYPDIADKIRGTEYDTYYADHSPKKVELINNFLKYLENV